MSHNENNRLETFCDGVFAIAITLLILEIKIPSVEAIHSVNELWLALGALWPSFFAFSLSFMIILIAWVNHHGAFKLLEKSSPLFMFVNGFFLLTIVVLPFPTGLMAEYIKTEYAQPAIVLYCFTCLLHNVAWNMFFAATLKPVPLSTNPVSILALQKGLQQCRFALIIYGSLTVFAWWFPYTALVTNTLLWFFWVYTGLAYKKESGSAV